MFGFCWLYFFIRNESLVFFLFIWLKSRVDEVYSKLRRNIEFFFLVLFLLIYSKGWYRFLECLLEI